MDKKHLYVVAAVIWGIPGWIIAIKGAIAYLATDAAKLWWLLLFTAGVLAGFFFMFRGIVDKYCARIAALPGKASLLQTFPLKGWILIFFMMYLGMALKFVGVPQEFTASFYSGLGPSLIVASCRFLLIGKRQ